MSIKTPKTVDRYDVEFSRAAHFEEDDRNASSRAVDLIATGTTSRVRITKHTSDYYMWRGDENSGTVCYVDHKSSLVCDGVCNLAAVREGLANFTSFNQITTQQLDRRIANIRDISVGGKTIDTTAAVDAMVGKLRLASHQNRVSGNW
jgi:hypothetical protein